MPNAYIAMAADRMACMARWLGKDDDAKFYTKIALAISTNLKAKVYDDTTGSFGDGLGVKHDSMQATLFPLMAGVLHSGKDGDVDVDPKILRAVVDFLRKKSLESCSWYLAVCFD